MFLLALGQQLNINLYKIDEGLDTLINLLLAEVVEAFRAELFYAEGSHRRAEDYGALHVGEADVTGVGKVPDETACESVAGSCWIEDFLQW